MISKDHVTEVIMLKFSFKITGIHYILKYFQIKSSYYNIVKIFNNITYLRFAVVLDQICMAGLGSRRELLKKNIKKIVLSKNVWLVCGTVSVCNIYIYTYIQTVYI